MCVSCGCGKLEDNHGDVRNITLGQLRDAAAAASIDMHQLTANLQNGLTARSARTDALAADLESMNEPLPSGQFTDKLESTPYSE